MNEGQVKKAIYDLCRGVMPNEVTIIWAEQNENRPSRPYMTLKLFSGPRGVGHDEERMNDSNELFIAGVREISLAVNFYGSKALEGLAGLQTSLRWPSVRESLYSSGLVFIRDSGVRDLSALLENRTETRAQMDIEFRLSENIVDDNGDVIDRAIVTNEIDDSETTIGLPE